LQLVETVYDALCECATIFRLYFVYGISINKYENYRTKVVL